MPGDSRFTPEDSPFARLVSLACHDLRTPLSTVLGFARTLPRIVSSDEQTLRYLEMIVSASSDMAETLDDLALVARIEAGRYTPTLRPADTLELARAAACRVGGDRVAIEGAAASALVDRERVERAVAAFLVCALRHGGLDRVGLAVAGTELCVRPIEGRVRGIVVGEDLRDLGAAIAIRVLDALGASVEVGNRELLVRLPADGGGDS